MAALHRAAAARRQPKIGTAAKQPFKKWFGDWQHDPENASKIVDSSGRPQQSYNYSKVVDEDGRWTSGGGSGASSGESAPTDGSGSQAATHAIASEAHTPPPPGKAFKPDVEADQNGDGITDAARVGVPAMSVPPPPKEIPRLPNLTDHEREVENDFATYFEKDPDGAAAAMVTNVLAIAKEKSDVPTFGTDDAKLQYAGWAGKGLAPEDRATNRATLNCALHQTANAITKRAFVQYLDTLPEGSKVLVTCGGCGAGKGYSLKSNADVKAMKDSSQAVWDSAGDQNATENPWIQKECEARGLTATYLYVHADPEKQWADPKMGVVQRASNPDDGRMVDAKVFADSYAIGAKNMAAFYLANKENKSAAFVFMDNTTQPKPSRIDGVPQSDLTIDREALTALAMKVIADRKEIPARVARGATVGARIWKGE